MELIRKNFIKALRLKSGIPGDKELIRIKRHQPVHLLLDGVYYFLTSHTYKNSAILKLDPYKELLFDKINKWFKEFKYELCAWVILDNHYHLLFRSFKGADLPKILSKIHTGFSYEINKLEDNQGRKIWQNYWDKCIRSEKDFWRHFNYIHHNPVKHKYVKEMDYKFSSLSYWKEKKGNEWLTSVFRQYPIIDFTVDNDE